MSKIRETVTASPLYWPPGWPRAKRRERASFRESNAYRETQAVLAELERMRVRPRDAIVSTNLDLRLDGIPRAGQKAPQDPGAAVWFVLKGEERVLACDRWDRVEHNLRAIAKHIEALRGQERWGVGSLEQAFRGFQALPEHASGQSPWEILGLGGRATSVEDVERAYKRRALACHPDHGGSPDDWYALQEARKAALEALSA